MDVYDITQLAIIATTVTVLGRIGWALARLIERRSSAHRDLPEEATERLRALEEESLAVRQELTELQERQDFTERALLRDPARAKPPAPVDPPERVVTPH